MSCLLILRIFKLIKLMSKNCNMIIKIFKITNVMTFNICKMFHVFKILNNFFKLNKVISNMKKI